MESKYAAAVSLGIQWLDATVPDWYKRIDLDTFEICNEKHCVLGQVFRDKVDPASLSVQSGYDWAWENYGFNLEETCALGFDMPFGCACADWQELAAEWTRVIKGLQSA